MAATNVFGKAGIGSREAETFADSGSSPKEGGRGDEGARGDSTRSVFGVEAAGAAAAEPETAGAETAGAELADAAAAAAGFGFALDAEFVAAAALPAGP